MPPAENTPVEPSATFLLVVESEDKAIVGKTVAVTIPRFIIGRGADSYGLGIGLQIADFTVSRYHADIRYMDSEGAGAFYLRDMNSENGTKLNGEHITAGEAVKLTDGDEIHTGFTMLKFSSAAES